MIIKRIEENNRFFLSMSNASETMQRDVFSQWIYCKRSNKEYVPSSIVNRFYRICNMLSITRRNNFDFFLTLSKTLYTITITICMCGMLLCQMK